MALTQTLRQLFVLVPMLVPVSLMVLAINTFAVDAVAAPAAHGAPERGALAPSAPVRLDYELPEVLPDSGTLTIPLRLSTPVSAGRLHFEVVRSEGLSVTGGGECHFDLNGASQPFPHELTVTLSAEMSRYVLVLVSVDGPLGSLSRSYRIDLATERAVVAPSTKSLKLLPASQPH